MAILEAMASGCAVIASKEPIGNAHLLAEGRGIAVDAGDAVQTSEALVRLVNDLELCRQMGRAARDYIATRHSPLQFRRNLQRVTCWSALDEILGIAKQSETVERERENEQWNGSVRAGTTTEQLIVQFVNLRKTLSMLIIHRLLPLL